MHVASERVLTGLLILYCCAALVVGREAPFTLSHVESSVGTTLHSSPNFTEAQPLELDTPSGRVRGLRMQDGVTGFFRLPYALPPNGDLRFRPPQPVPQWNTTLDVSNETAMYYTLCVQDKSPYPLSSYSGDEDCLYANIWVPPSVDLTKSQGAPDLKSVMVWIYGGAFTMGDSLQYGMYDGKRLSKYTDQVIVTFNYRLNVFGFFAHPALQAEDPDRSTGNYGLQDQTWMLEWVHQNIRSYGGDPSRVTIFGESAGAFSVCYHVSAPASAGLFSRAIIESGNCDSVEAWSPLERALRTGRDVADAIGCEHNLFSNKTAAEQRACLRAKSTEQMLKQFWYPGHNDPHPDPHAPGGTPGGTDRPVERRLFRNRGAPEGLLTAREGPAPAGESRDAPIGDKYSTSPLAPILSWYPTIDGSRAGVVDYPTAMFKAGRFNRVPLIIGTNKDEGVAFLGALQGVLPLHVRAPPLDAASIAALVGHFFYGNATTATRALAAYNASAFADQDARGAAIMTDYLFACPARRALRAMRAAGHADVWQYEFTYSMDWGRRHSHLDPHGSDLAFEFKNRGWRNFTANDVEMQDVFAGYWSALAKFGDPNKFADDSDQKDRPALPFWPRFGASEGAADLPSTAAGGEKLMRLAVPPVVGTEPRSSYCDFWDSVQPYHHP